MKKRSMTGRHKYCPIYKDAVDVGKKVAKSSANNLAQARKEKAAMG